MHIQRAAVAMQAQHQLQRHHQTRVIAPRAEKHPKASVELTEEQNNPSAKPLSTKSITAKISRGLSPNLLTDKLEKNFDEVPVDANVLIIKRILEAFLGKEIKLASYRESDVQMNAESGVQATTVETSEQEQWVHLSLTEKEVSEFAINAEITLANGITRKIVIEQSMARELKLELDVSANQAVKIIDPLVINFSGPVKLAGERVEFDLNGDGEKESIATFASNSAFLALDRNGDGKINDGSELFGAITGNGFAELAQFDEDGNGFIDAGDSIFSQLRVFDPGVDKLLYLNATNLEALYLGSVATPFTLKEGSEDLGYVRSTGFYLTENGAGTLQQIDLVV